MVRKVEPVVLSHELDRYEYDRKASFKYSRVVGKQRYIKKRHEFHSDNEQNEDNIGIICIELEDQNCKDKSNPVDRNTFKESPQLQERRPESKLIEPVKFESEEGKSHLHLQTSRPDTKASETQKIGPDLVTPPPQGRGKQVKDLPSFKRLYSKTSAQIIEGKKRRAEIEKTIKERAAERNGDAVRVTGKIPLSRAACMYERGIQRKKELDEWRLREQRDKEAKMLHMMRDYGKIPMQRGTEIYDRGQKFKLKLENMRMEALEKRDAEENERLKLACKGKISLDEFDRIYCRLLNHKASILRNREKEKRSV